MIDIIKIKKKKIERKKREEEIGNIDSNEIEEEGEKGIELKERDRERGMGNGLENKKKRNDRILGEMESKMWLIDGKVIDKSRR